MSSVQYALVTAYEYVCSEKTSYMSSMTTITDHPFFAFTGD